MKRNSLSILTACILLSACVAPAPQDYTPLAVTEAPAGYPSPALLNGRQQLQNINFSFIQDCPLPQQDQYDHAQQLRAPGEAVAPVTPAIRREWVNGCAIVRFTVDDRGYVATAEPVSEVPPGTFAPAADILRLNRFANTSGNHLGSPMLIRVGMAEPSLNSTYVSLGFR